MLQLAPGWQLEVERGPDWLFVHLDQAAAHADESPQLAEKIWELMQQHFVNRVVLELDSLTTFSSYVVGQLVLLHKRVVTQGGMVRLAGLSERNQQVLHLARLSNRFPSYRDRSEAVRGHRPLQPR